MNYLLAFLIPLLLVADAKPNILISKDSKNGIYITRNYNSKEDFLAFALCKDPKTSNIRVGVRTIKDGYISSYLKSENNIKIEKWKPLYSEMLKTKKLPDSIKYFDGEILIFYIRAKKNKIEAAHFITGDDYVYSIFGKKLVKTFEIIDEDTKKVKIICQSE